MHNDVNKTSSISVVTAFDSNNYYLTLNFEQCDSVYAYENSEYIDMAEILNNNKATLPIPKDSFNSQNMKFKLVKDNLPRYATVTVYAENGALKYEPVLYSNTPFS